MAKQKEEMAPNILSALYPVVIFLGIISRGFLCFLTVDDLALDILARFIKCAFVDDILSIRFLDNSMGTLKDFPKHLRFYKRLGRATFLLQTMLSLRSKNGVEAPMSPLRRGKKIIHLLREYVKGRDTIKAYRCIWELGFSFFHHEIVNRTLVIAMDPKSGEPLVLKLLKKAVEEGLISFS